MIKIQYKFLSFAAILSVLAAATIVTISIVKQKAENVSASIEPDTHNLWGFAWNETTGWLSFNSANCDTDGDLTYEGNNEAIIPGGGAAPSGCPTSGAVADYGVKINDDGTIAEDSYAWSETKGYLRFDAPGPYPASPQTSVKYDRTTKKFIGWARFCSLADVPANCNGGTAGWVKMSGSCGAACEYSVTMNDLSQLSGHAYSDDYQYISFNCLDGGAGKTNICGTSNYKVSKVANVWGYIWNPAIGYISMNCANPEIKECGGGHFYGVHFTKLDNVNYQLKGYGWSSTAGWVDFAPAGPYPDIPNNGVYVDKVSGSSTGWAKILSYGDDGWIRMSDDTNANWVGRGVKADYSKYPVEFSGFAWNRNTANYAGVGWISFASSTPGAGGGEYHVYSYFNTPPIVNVDASDLALTNQCDYIDEDHHVLNYLLNWDYVDIEDGDDNQFGYEIEVKTTGGAWGTDDIYHKTIKSPTAGYATTQDVFGNYDPSDSGFYSGSIAYSTSYDIRVRVRDSFDFWSTWSDTINMTTIPHEYPHAKFIWFIENPSMAEEVKFSSISSELFTSGTNSKTICDDTTPTCAFQWSALPATAQFIDLDTASSTRIKFPTRDSYAVTLEVTDNDGLACSTSSPTIKPTFRLPTWKESR